MKVTWDGCKLRVRCKHLGLTMAELAVKINCSRPLISIWEDNKAALTGYYLVLLDIVLNVEPKEFNNLEDEGVQL